MKNKIDPLRTAPKKQTEASLSLPYDSMKLLQSTCFWTPPVPAWKPLREMPNSSLRFACIAEDRLYHGLRFEGELMLLTPQNWKLVLKYSKPDMLIIESIWGTATGHWEMGQCNSSPARGELLEIVSLAQKLSIPTVFWITKGHEYHEHYKTFATCFDYVFCSDPKEADMLRPEGVKAEVLLPCVQPAVYNPFRIFDHYNDFNIELLFDGWADLDRLTDELKILKEIKGYGLSIVESRYRMFRSRLKKIPDYKDCILGCLTRQSKILALKYSKMVLSFDTTLSTTTNQQWMALEAAATHLPSVHLGSIPEDDMRKKILLDHPEQIDFLAEISRFKKDKIYRDRQAHLAWRHVNQHHTFSHRIQTICDHIGIQHDWKQYPKASVITPIYKEDSLNKCIANYKKQSYINKELLIVFSGNPNGSTGNPGKDIKVLIAPKELLAGACLNIAYLELTGDYCFRMDGDAQYGENYISDLILYLNALDVNIFGKPFSNLYSTSKDIVYLQYDKYQNCILPMKNIQNDSVMLGGNTISFKKNNHMLSIYSNYDFGEIDSYLLVNPDVKSFVIMDNFNVSAEKKENQVPTTSKTDTDVLNNDKDNIFAENEQFFI